MLGFLLLLLLDKISPPPPLTSWTHGPYRNTPQVALGRSLGTGGAVRAMLGDERGARANEPWQTRGMERTAPSNERPSNNQVDLG